MRLVFEFLSLLRQGLSHPQPLTEALPLDDDREPSARDYEVYYWSPAPGPWY